MLLSHQQNKEISKEVSKAIIKNSNEITTTEYNKLKSLLFPNNKNQLKKIDLSIRKDSNSYKNMLVNEEIVKERCKLWSEICFLKKNQVEEMRKKAKKDKENQLENLIFLQVFRKEKEIEEEIKKINDDSRLIFSSDDKEKNDLYINLYIKQQRLYQSLEILYNKEINLIEDLIKRDEVIKNQWRILRRPYFLSC